MGMPILFYNSVNDVIRYSYEMGDSCLKQLIKLLQKLVTLYIKRHGKPEIIGESGSINGLSVTRYSVDEFSRIDNVNRITKIPVLQVTMVN